MSQCSIDMKKSILLLVLVLAAVFTTQAYPKLVATVNDETSEFVRHKHLVEHITSQGCAYCPWGDQVLELLAEMRDDIVRVSIHNNLNATDQFRTFKSSAIGDMLVYTSMPVAAFDRTPYNGEFMQVVSINPEYFQDKAQFFSDQLDTNIKTPVLADVVIDAAYDADTRKLTVKVTGDVKSNFQSTFGNNVGLTIYLTEDSLVAWQQNLSTHVEDYVHNNVFRETMTHYKGDALKWNDGKTRYENEYTFTLKNEWLPENMNVVAFVHRSTATRPVQPVINCQTLAIRDLLTPPVEPVRGDITGDGVVDIADVNAVINMMLGKEVPTTVADVTGDENVDIADVNAIINIMLGKI